MITPEQRAEFRTHFRYNVKRRIILDKIIKGAVFACVVVAIVPLVAILVNVFTNGSSALSWEFLTQIPGAVGSDDPGGIGPAIQGTIVLIGLSSLIGVPVGIMGGIFLSEYGNNKYGRMIRFFNDVLAEFPTIVIGVFTFVLIVLTVGNFSVWAGSFALSIVMLPIIMRTTEESLKLVPVTYREAGYALGIRRYRVVFTIVLSSAKNGLVTGILLSVARIAGETAPLVFTILGSSQFLEGLDGPVDALPLRIWRLSSLPYDSAVTQGWGAAFVLIILVLSINIGVRYMVLRKKEKTRIKFRKLGAIS
ncbi:Phosphate ABC transporter, inner membrane subunit PstA [Nitrosotalea sinensis]|jgi:phosphate transport system permease protein|uniref:Phosphate transport system permease protein PstA n=1 Tax=Nitrosotalea sinensis TaxID=1499975 RepID=A0A2H1EJG9_9ARCH|nr:phosphate ABC transporter permease PstA [Candidatus Nitrosotalea sinensis]SHO48006.1 Phosphate ABC transporter, inner membrane subunit PstA [Candidatus Nitrosotalea sinensis]